VKSASRSFTVTVRATRPDCRMSLLARSTRVSSLAASAASSSRSVANVFVAAHRLGLAIGLNRRRSIPRVRSYSQLPFALPASPPRLPLMLNHVAHVRRPKRAKRSWNLGPISGMSASANWSMSGRRWWAGWGSARVAGCTSGRAGSIGRRFEANRETKSVSRGRNVRHRSGRRRCARGQAAHPRGPGPAATSGSQASSPAPSR